MKFVFSILILACVFYNCNAEKKLSVLYYFENPSDSCKLGKNIWLWDEDASAESYDYLRMSTCDKSFVDYDVIDSSTVKLANGMSSSLVSGKIEDSSFIFLIYSYIQKKNIMKINYNFQLNKIVLTDYNETSVEESNFSINILLNYYNTRLSLSNPNNLQVNSITFYDYLGRIINECNISSTDCLISIPFEISGDYPIIVNVKTNSKNLPFLIKKLGY